MSASKRPRQGSLAWYHNSKRGVQVPSIPKKNPCYFMKVQCLTIEHDNKYVCATRLMAVPYERKDGRVRLKLSTLRVRKSDVSRESLGVPEDIKESKKVIITGFTNSKGIIGATARRGLKLQKRKARGAGTVRHPGCMGCRHAPGTSWRKPFAGRAGGGQRTIRGSTLVRWIATQGNPEILIKGSVPGRRGTVIAVRHQE